MTEAVVLVVAKAPVPGEAKTRLGAVVGPEHAADLAAAALLDTLEACEAAFGTDRCHLALAGDLVRARSHEELERVAARWHVHPQRGEDFAQRLLHAHQDVHAATGAPVVQVGMDTPQLAPDVLDGVARSLVHREDAVLGPALDGGWWLLGVGGPHLLAHLAGVPMSRDDTGRLTRAALERAGARVGETVALRDVDEVADARLVAEQAPGTRFARLWAEVSPAG